MPWSSHTWLDLPWSFCFTVRRMTLLSFPDSDKGSCNLHLYFPLSWAMRRDRFTVSSSFREIVSSAWLVVLLKDYRTGDKLLTESEASSLCLLHMVPFWDICISESSESFGPWLRNSFLPNCPLLSGAVSSTWAALAISSWSNCSHSGDIFLGGFRSLERRWLVSLLQLWVEDLSLLFMYLITSWLSRRRASRATHVIGSVKTRVIRVGKYSDAKPPGTWCLDVWWPGNVFPSPILVVDCLDDIPKDSMLSWV